MKRGLNIMIIKFGDIFNIVNTQNGTIFKIKNTKLFYLVEKAGGFKPKAIWKNYDIKRIKNK